MVTSKYFPEEIPCNCGCGEGRTEDALVIKLDYLRECCGFPIHANSIVRCPDYNKSVGGKETSSHVASEIRRCKASDLRIPNDYKKRMIFMKHVHLIFDRVGLSVKGGFVHVDVDTQKLTPCQWFYK